MNSRHENVKLGERLLTIALLVFAGGLLAGIGVGVFVSIVWGFGTFAGSTLTGLVMWIWGLTYVYST